MATNVTYVWAGALTDTSVKVVARTSPATNGSILVADNSAMTGAATIGPVTATGNGMLTFAVSGLTKDTRYWYVVDAGGQATAYKGSFKTHPGPAGTTQSYIFGAAGDAGLTGTDGGDTYITNAVSNNPVFDTMKAQSASEGWLWFSHLGDLHYRNYNTNTPSNFRQAYNDVHNFNSASDASARQGAFLRGQAITYVWDDHDFGADNSNRTSASNAAANLVYRECVPSYPLAATGDYQSWQVGRVLYIASDSRSFRDPNGDPQSPTKTMLGTAQRAWMEGLLTSAHSQGVEAVVWQSPSRWIGGADTFSSFADERNQLVEMFGDTGWLGRMVYMTADEHALSFCSGPANPYGQFPMMMFASMDSSFGTNSTAIYDVGQSQGRQRYGTMRVVDSGNTISLTGTGYINGALWKALSHYVTISSPVIAPGGIPTPPPPASTPTPAPIIRREPGDRFHEEIRGSHEVVSYVDVISPSGQVVRLAATEGEVTVDRNADVRRTFDGKAIDWTGTLTPTNEEDILTPYGTEIRPYRGVKYADDAEEIYPLGVFGLSSSSVQYSAAGSAEISISGYDRSRSIRLDKFTSPYTVAAGTNLLDAIKAIISRTLPGAEYDAITTTSTTTAPMLFDAGDDPWTACQQLAKSMGCEIYFDVAGRVAVVPPPDIAAQPAPEFSYYEGDLGALLSLGREFNDDGAFNGVIVTGESPGDDKPPVRGEAWDDSPTSPTYRHGPFGERPTFVTDDTAKTVEDCQTIAKAQLALLLGKPAQLDISGVVNPAFEAGDVIEVQLGRAKVDGLFGLDAFNVPLSASAAQKLSVRERRPQ